MLILNAGDLVFKPSTVIGAEIDNEYICWENAIIRINMLHLK